MEIKNLKTIYWLHYSLCDIIYDVAQLLNKDIQLNYFYLASYSLYEARLLGPVYLNCE
jgi:hypothetical protein